MIAFSQEFVTGAARRQPIAEPLSTFGLRSHADPISIKDERKVEDVLRFLRDIDFLEASQPSVLTGKPRVPGLFKNKNRITEDFDAELPDSFWSGKE